MLLGASRCAKTPRRGGTIPAGQVSKPIRGAGEPSSIRRARAAMLQADDTDRVAAAERIQAGRVSQERVSLCRSAKARASASARAAPAAGVDRSRDQPQSESEAPGDRQGQERSLAIPLQRGRGPGSGTEEV